MTGSEPIPDPVDADPVDADPVQAGSQAEFNPQRPAEDSGSTQHQFGSAGSSGAVAGRVMVMAGAGLELAATVLVFGAIGAGMDRWLQSTQSLGLVFVGLAGFALAMYRFIKQAIEATRRASDEARLRKTTLDPGQQVKEIGEDRP